MNEKLNVAVLFGGSSDEYHVSLHSAACCGHWIRSGTQL